jgi:TM2 domain-containing membrane protein YozV
MAAIQPILAPTNLNPQQQSAFYAQMAACQKDEVVGVLFALFLGAFGVHHFYLRRNGLGVLYLLFFWTGVPMVLGWIEAFFMPGRVRCYNAQQAIWIASALAGGWYPVFIPVPGVFPGYAIPGLVVCGGCSFSNPSMARFCSRCGRALGAM